MDPKERIALQKRNLKQRLGMTSHFMDGNIKVYGRCFLCIHGLCLYSGLD
jgi:hypothetical protein